MDKNDIIEYVMHTPGNTNKAVLSSMLNQISSSGDGENSDFSIAEVTVINNTSDTIPNLMNNIPIIIENETNDSPACIAFAPMVIVNRTVTFIVPLYKGKCIWSSQCFVDAGNVSLSGNIEDYYGQAYIITGDCTITISDN